MTATGCAIEDWQGSKVAMLCFRRGADGRAVGKFPEIPVEPLTAMARAEQPPDQVSNLGPDTEYAKNTLFHLVA